MKVTVDTNLLVRIIVGDDPAQEVRARSVFGEADLIVIAAPCLCETFWVLRTRYGFVARDIGEAIRELLALPGVDVDGPAVDAGLDLLEAGGDFSDGLIAFDGRRRGGVVFVTFDRRAIRKLKALGMSARLP